MAKDRNKAIFSVKLIYITIFHRSPKLTQYTLLCFPTMMKLYYWFFLQKAQSPLFYWHSV
jgi:hypothetical protein